MKPYRPILTALALAALAVPFVALAHAGEDHGAPPPAPARQGAAGRTIAATSDSVELVVRWPDAGSAEELTLRVLASDTSTNAPIEGGTIELEFGDEADGEVAVTARPTSSPGVYEASARFPKDGPYSLVATVRAGELTDVVVLPGFEVRKTSPESHVAETPSAGRTSLRWIAAGVSLAVVAGFLLRRKRAAASAAALFVAVSLLPIRAWSHGGEDHGDEGGAHAGVAAPPGAPVYLAKESQFLLGVRTVPAEQRAIVSRIRTQGRLAAPPERMAPVFSPQPGRLVAAPKGFPNLGSRVQKGQVLAVVEGSMSAAERASFSAEAASSRASAARATAQLDASRRKLQRMESLEGIVSRQDVEAAQVEVRSAEAELEAARSAIRAYGGHSGAGAFPLVSPIDGVLAEVAVSPGELVDSQRRLFLVVDARELWLEANVFEADVGRVEAAHDAIASVEAYPGERFTGSLLSMGQVVAPATRTVQAIYRVPNSDGRLKVGMFAAIEVASGGAREGLVVPESAIVEQEGRKLVFVHTAPEEFRAQEVAIGNKDGTNIEIRDGLQPGDRVVTVGTYALRNAPPVVR